MAPWLQTLEHTIGPVEAYAVAVARMVWHQFLVTLLCFYFIDNNAAMDAFVRGNSHSSIFRDILLCFEDQELRGAHLALVHSCALAI